LENTYTYRIPSDLEKTLLPGCRVIVHFGKKRYYTAIVAHIREREPDRSGEIKDLYALLDAAPILCRPQLRFWQWISSYYLCKLGDVYKAALPSGLKMESETMVVCNEGFEPTLPLRPAELSVLDAFGAKQKLTLSELEKTTGLRNVLPVVASLLTRGAVAVSEELKKGYTPKMQTFIRLSPACCNEEKLQEAFTELKRAPRQETLLISYLDLSRALNPQPTKEIAVKELLEYSRCSPSVLEGLLRRGVLERYEKETGRLRIPVGRPQPLNPLTKEQTQAYHQALEVFKTKDVCLLHGVASSGKTEIYTHLINDVLQNGRQALYLLPEIAVTRQITERMARIFGNKLLVYHSGFSDNERVEVWNRLLQNNTPVLVLGTRSALFLPFRNLGLVVVDQEHENSYKQQDPAPRYHAGNAAIVLANMHGGKTLLASATPSIDSYYNALTGKYGLAELQTPCNDYRMPEILTVNIKELKRKKIMKNTLFSPPLLQKMKEALEKGEQIILFQNRRGFAPVMECRSCGWTPHCMNCDVSMTYHKSHHCLTCHYCGYTMPLPRQCPQCGDTNLRMSGFGTEKIEEEVATLFPSAQIKRLDFDSARTRTAAERIISDFEKGKTQILIGTQMLSGRGNFGNVTVAGILNADSLMNFPDFRAHERAYQLMLQVSTRTGGKGKQGVVVLQTSQTEHPLIRMVQTFAYKEMANLQLSERSMFRYPPYYRLIVVVLKCKQEEVLKEVATVYVEKLRARLGERVSDPVAPPISRIQSFHIKKILLKIEATASIAPVREIIEKVHLEMQDVPFFKQLWVYYDVDPV
jgi:primosomal protein N' (replication factor Y)